MPSLIEITRRATNGASEAAANRNRTITVGIVIAGFLLLIGLLWGLLTCLGKRKKATEAQAPTFPTGKGNLNDAFTATPKRYGEKSIRLPSEQLSRPKPTHQPRSHGAAPYPFSQPPSPPPYTVPAPAPAPPPFVLSAPSGTILTVKQTFTPIRADELSIETSEPIRILESFPDGWCAVERLESHDKEMGVVPAWVFIERDSRSGARVRPQRNVSLVKSPRSAADRRASQESRTSWSHFS